MLSATALVAGEAKKIPDHQLGLSKSKVTEVVDPPAEKKNLSDPGDAARTPADFRAQPPLIPHGVADYLPITAEANMCVLCHAVAEKEEGTPTPMPASHYTDLRNSPEKAGDEIVGARYVCVSCHLSPGENEVIVENLYRSGE